MAEEKLTQEEMARAAKEFLEGIAEDATRRKIPPSMVVSLFGFFARSIIEAQTDIGRDRKEAISEIAGLFMEGLGVQTLFQHVTLSEERPKTTH